MTRKLAIMQPYFLPYIGYFQLMRAVDVFVVYDDVQFMKGGWIERNRMLVNGAPHWFGLTLEKASHKLAINQRFFAADIEGQKKALLYKVHCAYAKAPHYAETMALLEEILANDERNVAAMLARQLRILCRHLGIETELRLASEMVKNDDLGGEARVIDMAQRLGADHYVNAAGGQALYSRENFAHHGIRLSFLQSRPVVYRQYAHDFVPWLSILDVLMFNSVEQTRELLLACDLT
jgi:hypothetical protein